MRGEVTETPALICRGLVEGTTWEELHADLASLEDDGNGDEDDVTSRWMLRRPSHGGCFLVAALDKHRTFRLRTDTLGRCPVLVRDFGEGTRAWILGSTPGGDAPHVPVLMRQVLDAFDGRQVRCYVDGTMGAGGHASAIIRQHPELRTFVGFDVDPLAHSIARPRLEAAAAEAKGASTSGRDAASSNHGPLAINTVQSNFRHMRERLAELELIDGAVDAILMDLGVSSMHLDRPERGFSFMNDGPLDMRMGPGANMSASDVVNGWPEEELARIIRDYGEEKHWRLLARRICERPLRELRYHLVQECQGALAGDHAWAGAGFMPRHSACTAAIDALAPGGRLAIITFHSLEDKIVKNAFRLAAGRPQPSDRPLSAWEPQPELPPKIVKLVTRKPLVADKSEVDDNARSRSAKLRICEKL